MKNLTQLPPQHTTQKRIFDYTEDELNDNLKQSEMDEEWFEMFLDAHSWSDYTD